MAVSAIHAIDAGEAPHGTAAVLPEGFLDYQYRVLGIRQYIEAPDVEEICINGPGECYVDGPRGWDRVAVAGLTAQRARQFCIAVVNESNTGQRITDIDPMVSLTFPSGQRAQLVIPPACEAGRVSITLRQPARRARSLAEYAAEGFFDTIVEGPAQPDEGDRHLLELRAAGRYREFLREAVRCRKNIVISGATGSGKTTFMKALVRHVPDSERLITIEDARELFIQQPNVVHLLYGKGGQVAINVTAKACMEACLRMRPDRIILAELRGDEAFYFIRNCASGHPGSITSCHAGSVAQTWDQLALMVKASPEGAGLDFDVIRRLLMLTIDIVVHLRARAGRRCITGIDFAADRLLPGRARAPDPAAHRGGT